MAVKAFTSRAKIERRYGNFHSCYFSLASLTGMIRRQARWTLGNGTSHLNYYVSLQEVKVNSPACTKYLTVLTQSGSR